MKRRKGGISINGWINIDKPSGMTSNQVIGKVRRLLNAQKLGHAGTLDPIASGVLPIALGEATKTVQFAQDHEKSYRFTITWGEERNTDDIEGEVVKTSSSRPTPEEVEESSRKFIGDIQQTPPQFSAIKINGERAYNLARAGEEVDIKPRIVSIYDLKLIRADKDTAEMEVHCGKGTYVRSIARDMGRDLGCFGHISQLRRTSVGNFTENNAISLDKLEKMVLDCEPQVFLMPVETVLDDIPVLALTDKEIQMVRNGQPLTMLSSDDLERLSLAEIDGETDLVLALGNSQPLALMEKHGCKLQPMRLFNL